MASQHHSPETTCVSTNRELFRPSANTGNPQYDFYTHYSRLSGLQRLALERHTVNGNQISRYEPDISHSTTCVKAPGFVVALQRRAFELLSVATLILTLSTNASASTSDCVRSALYRFDLDAIEAAEKLLTVRLSSHLIPTSRGEF